MDASLDRRDFLTRVATVSLAVTGGAMLGATAVPTLATTQEASPDAEPIPVAELPTPTDDGIDVPVLGIAFGSEKIVATPKVPAGTVRILTAVPYEDFGSVIFRIPDDRPHAIDQIWAAFAQPEPEIPSWVFDLYCPGGVRTDYRYGTTAEGFISLLPGVYAVMDFATGRSTTFVAMGSTNGAIDPKDVPYMGASFVDGAAFHPDAHAVVAATAHDRMTYTGLEHGVPAGRRLWKFSNGGEMFHNIYVYGTPADVTPDDILASVMSEDENAFDGYTGGLMNTQTLSPGAVQYFYLDLQPGPHAAHCTESDGQGPPHFFMGMIVTFEVA